MSPNETTAPGSRRRRRHRAVSSGVALVVGTLVLGGITTYAAATESAGSQIVSLNAAPAVGSDDIQATTTTTTPTAPPAAPAAPASVTGSSTGGPGVAVTQTIGIAVLPGSLSVTPSTESVPLTERRAVDGAAPDAMGTLSPITADDARGSLVGWRVTVSLQAVSGLDAAQLASTRLCVTPHPTTLVAGNPADIVRSSPRACAGPGDPVAVFSAAPGGGGGEYSDTAGVDLVLPSGAPVPATASFAVAVS